ERALGAPAIVRDAYGSVDVLRLAEIDPPVAGESEVLARVHTAGLDQGVWHLMTPSAQRRPTCPDRPRRGSRRQDRTLAFPRARCPEPRMRSGPAGAGGATSPFAPVPRPRSRRAPKSGSTRAGSEARSARIVCRLPCFQPP